MRPFKFRPPHQRATTYFFANLQRRESLCKRVYMRALGEELRDEACKECSVRLWSGWKVEEVVIAERFVREEGDCEELIPDLQSWKTWLGPLQGTRAIGLSFFIPPVSNVDGFGEMSFRSQSSRFALFRFLALAESLRNWAAASASPLHCTSTSSIPSVLAGSGPANRLDTRASSVSESTPFMSKIQRIRFVEGTRIVLLRTCNRVLSSPLSA